jgi:hypothetical protein
MTSQSHIQSNISSSDIDYLIEYKNLSYYKYLPSKRKKEIECVINGKCKRTKDITKFVKQFNKCFELYDLSHINFKIMNEGIVDQKKFKRYDREYEKIRDKFSNVVNTNDINKLCKDTEALNDIIL